MPAIEIDGVTYDDGYYSAVCIREKKVKTFWGVVRLTETGRIIAEGPCPTDGTIMTKVLYVP